MGETIGIDSLLGGWAMPKAYSGEMRERVIAEVESGASRREAAEEFAVSASTAVIWVKCFRQTGRCAAKPRGGSISPLEKHADFLLGLIEKQPDLTLDEVVLAMRKHKIPGGRTAVWRFFNRHKITFKKKPARSGARARGRGEGAPALDTRGATLRYLPQYSPDGNPIEMPFSKLKASLRKAGERTIPRLRRRIARFACTLAAREACNYFRHAGYK